MDNVSVNEEEQRYGPFTIRYCMRRAIVAGKVEYLEELLGYLAELMPNENNKKVYLDSVHSCAECRERARIPGTELFRHSKHFCTLLTLAISKNNWGCVTLLINACASVNQADGNCKTPIQWAILRGSDDIVGLLIKSGADLGLNTEYDPQFIDSGRTPLALSVTSGNKVGVSMLLAAGADVNLGGFPESSPLLMAVGRGLTEIVKILLDAGADYFSLQCMYGSELMPIIDIVRKFSANDIPLFKQMLPIFEDRCNLDATMQSEIVKMSAIMLPAELADICGDFSQFTPTRRELCRSISL